MRMMKEIATRRSIRKYKAEPVSDDVIRQLLESACLAPSGSNTQPWHFIVVRDPQIKAQLAAASHQQQWMLAATELALGTCWVAWFTQAAIRPILNIPEDKYVVGILTLGYAAEEPAARPRKNIEDVLHYDLW